MNRNQVDFEVTGRLGNTVALIDVKNVPRLTLSSAAELRKDLLEDDTTNSLPVYFLIISQDKSFLWEPEQAGATDAEPAAAFSMSKVLREYLTDHELDRHLRGAELEIVVLQWLSDITRGRGPIPKELVKFAESLRGAEVHGGVRQ